MSGIPKLKELGLVNDQERSRGRCTTAQARVALTQLRRIPRGDTIEEDHQRDRALIANYIKDKTGAIESVRNERQDLRPREGLPEDARRRRHAAAPS